MTQIAETAANGHAGQATGSRRCDGAASGSSAILLFAGLPLVFRSGSALTMLSLMGIMIIFALSYNMLLGQTGMLSFGHAVYYGLGAFFVVHAMNAIIRARYCPFRFPSCHSSAGLPGWCSRSFSARCRPRRGGTAFAMISLGLAELVASSSLILRGFFGGEEGITTNRTRLFRILRHGISARRSRSTI